MEIKPIICDVCNKTIDNPTVANQRWHSGCRAEGYKRYQKQRRDAKRALVPMVKKQCYCGRWFECSATNKKRVMCREPSCLQNYQNNRTKENFKKNSIKQKKYEYEKRVVLIEARKNESQTIPAKCPGCGVIHQYTFTPAWLGIGTPRINCPRYPACINDEHNRTQVEGGFYA